MSFIYSQALVAASSPDKCSDTDVSVPSNGSPTPKPCLWHDKTMEVSRLSRYGMTCAPLTADRGAELLTSWLAGFPVRTSALQEKVQELTAPGRACGDTWRASLAKFDPVSSSWKTAQPSLLGDSEESSVTWPRSGMTAGGLCWELPMLEPRTSGTDFGFLLPTPSASDPQLERRAKHGEHYQTETGTVRRINADGTSSNLGLVASARMWPTPTVCGNYNRKGASATSGDGLATAVRMWPTPICRDSRTVKGGARTMNAVGSEPLITQVAIAEGATDGALNPPWVEWLQGWPIGWTDLKRLATARSPNAPPQPSDTYPQPLSEEQAA